MALGSELVTFMTAHEEDKKRSRESQGKLMKGSSPLPNGLEDLFYMLPHLVVITLIIKESNLQPHQKS